VTLAGLPDRLADADQALDAAAPSGSPPAGNVAYLVEALGLVVDELGELRLVVARLQAEEPAP
jgi:hypothetical protein